MNSPDSITIDLPMPPRKLNPNDRGHRLSAVGSKKKAREDASLVTRAAANRTGFKPSPSGVIPIHLLFQYSTRRARDRDNAEASCKAMLDGIADALGVNDTRFRVTSDFDPMLTDLPTVRVTIRRQES